jgi:cystathionine gamma-synthase
MSEQRSAADSHRWQGFATKAIHAGYRPDPGTGAVNALIYASSTFKQDGVGGLRGGFEYARTGNRPVPRWRRCSPLSRPEPTGGLLIGNGGLRLCAARGAAPGDHVVIPDDAYGGTFRLIDKVFREWGVHHTPVPLADLDAVRAAITGQTRLIWVETPTNPLLSIADIPAIVEVAGASGVKVLVDNTFASPALQQPLTLGADIVLHSTTKYIGGHSDVVGGALVTDDEELDARFGFAERRGCGPRPVRRLPDHARPQDARAADAAALRERRRLAAFLADHAAVSQVLYPGLPSHPGHDVAARQMRGFGGMISVRMRRRAGRPRPVFAHRGFHPRRIAGRGGVADRASGRDDPRLDGGLTAGGARRSGPDVGRHRGRRRPARRPGAGASLVPPAPRRW